MEILGRFFRRREKKILGSDIFSVREQIASNIKMFIFVRGHRSLLNTRLAIVMRKNFETFVTEGVIKIENPKGTHSTPIYMAATLAYQAMLAGETDFTVGNRHCTRSGSPWRGGSAHSSHLYEWVQLFRYRPPAGSATRRPPRQRIGVNRFGAGTD